MARIAAAVCSANGRAVSTVAVGPYRTLKNGRLSTLITRPTSSGRRCASISPVSPPIEWPITAGRSSPASRT